MKKTAKKAPAQKKNPAPLAEPVQTMAELLHSGEPGKALASWNGMKVYVVDPTNGKVLVNAGADKTHDPASLTKMMSGYLAFEDIRDKKFDPNTTIEMSAEAAKLSPNKVKANKQYTGTELIGAMMIGSDNAASQALSQRQNASIMQRMNDKAKQLGLRNTHFANVHGLPEKGADINNSTPRDMATLIQRIHKDFPDAAKQYMTATGVNYGGHYERAHHFLNDKKAATELPQGYQIEAKTGYTNRANHNIASHITAPNGKQLVVVVMGADWTDRAKLRQAGISHDILPVGMKIKGNHVRDALVHQMTMALTAGKSQAVAVAPPEKPQFQPVPPPPLIVEPAKTPAPQKPEMPRLSAADMKAVEDCKKTIKVYTRPGPEATAAAIDVPKQPTHFAEHLEKMAGLEARLKKAQKPAIRKALEREVKTLRNTIDVEQKVLTQLTALENQADPAIYTRKNYDATIDRAQTYLDAFVDDWKGALPPGGKPALKNQMRAIAQGAAGMETGWNPEIVKSAANRRPHTGVYQTEWAYLADAKKEVEKSPAMNALLKKFPDDQKFLEIAAQWQAAKGLPTTSFAGQGVAFAGMAAASFERFLEKGGKPQDFSGGVIYQDHMMGASGALKFRNQLREHPNQRGKPGVSKGTYDGNYLVSDNPYGQLNDLNPKRLTYENATAQDVQGMMTDKYIHARNKMEKHVQEGKLGGDRLMAFEQAFLPQWTGNAALKANDIARVMFQKETGLKLRDEAQATVNDLKKDKKGISAVIHNQTLCEILKPMPLFTPKPDAGPKRG